MAKLEWDKSGARFFETGVSKGVLYPITEGGEYGIGVVWNGLTGVTESPSGAEITSLYADDIKYLNLVSAEEFGFTIEAYSSPDEFDACDGTATLNTGISIGQQKRQGFGFCYQTRQGNDVQNTNYGYKIHIIYNCLASPSEKGYQTINDSPEAITLSWEAKSTPIAVTDHDPTCVLIIGADALTKIENALYGDTSEDPKLLTPDEIINLIQAE